MVILTWGAAFAALAAIAVLVLERVTGRRDAQMWPKFGVQLGLVAGFLVPAWLGGAWFDAVCVFVTLVGWVELLRLPRSPPAGAPGRTAELALAMALVALGALCLRALVALSALHFAFFYAVVELNDSFADIVGRHIGRTPLFPRLSPRKTWEGMLAGIAAAGCSAALLASWLGPSVGVATCAVLGVLLGACAVLADLAASALKRRFGAKDFSELLPSHGGLLDACDSLLLVAPVFLWLLRALG